ncbi:hypothetical protein H257_04695 [Aphanomyces astaci]|uniref:Uncharacterized protein n=1 Tax=Aphanomyces astaci TaxID=112090 RepID=W4GT54_APHAT|nr:hypothetical protein H257_04695 [Aphanomyces astaci]ETV82925.1 hypothetical protein H257_04695 [Aphanomyces astaci]|eukprot:XP_009827596.1 hypothetical protein H257_04695 [Aphanomyces astaci]
MEGSAEDREIEITLKEELASEQAAKQARLKEEMEQARLSELIHGYNVVSNRRQTKFVTESFKNRGNLYGGMDFRTTSWNPTFPPIDQAGIRFAASVLTQPEAKSSKGGTISSSRPKDEKGWKVRMNTMKARIKAMHLDDQPTFFEKVLIDLMTYETNA